MNMRAWSKIGVAAALLLVAVAAQPALANCPSPIGVNTAGEWVISNPAWPEGSYYGYQTGPSVSPQAVAVYWALTGGNPTLGAGADNGSYIVTLNVAPNYAPLEGVGDYFYPRVINEGNPMNWQAAPVDGCITATGSNPTVDDNQQCTCVLVSDTWGVGDAATSYYAVVSAFRDQFNNYNPQTGDSDISIGSDGTPFNDIVLAEVPAPRVVGSSGDASGKILNVVSAHDIDHPAPDNNGDACGCLQGYRILGVVTPSGAPAPPRDLAQWTELQSGSGTAQATTPIGSPTSVRVNCGVGQQAYITTVIAFDSGYRGRYVSSNATRVNCDPNLADPSRPERPGKPIGSDPGRPERGKGSANGR
jgi:hypothetical protein